MDGWNMLDLDQLVSVATDRRESKADYGRAYPASLIPLFYNGVNGDILYVDGATDESDPPLWSYSFDVSKRAERVGAFVETFLDDLEDGKYVYIPADEQRGSYDGEEPVLAPWYEFSPDELPDWDDRLDTDADVFDPSQAGPGLTFSGLAYDVTDATLRATARGDPPTSIAWRFEVTATLVTRPGGISPPREISVRTHDAPESDPSAVEDWTAAAGLSVALNSRYEHGEEPHVLAYLEEHVAVTDGEYEFVSLADGGVGLELSGRIDSRSGTNRPITIATPLEFEGEQV